MSSSVKAKCAFVYAGIGTQWKTMGADLLLDQPVFRDAIGRCDTEFAKFSDWSIIEEISRPESSSRIDDLLIAHPCNVAIQIGLGALLNEWQIVPHGVVGHSSGEVAAAYIAGILSLQDAMRITWRHCELMAKIIGKGVLLHIGLSAAEVKQRLESEPSEIWIAAMNSPSATVVTGAADILAPLIRQLENKSVFCRILRINIPYHSPVVEPFINDLYNGICNLKTNPPHIPIYSTLRGGLALSDDFGARYWPEHIRQPVRFAETINAMLAEGYTTFIEITPHGVLGGAIEECANEFYNANIDSGHSVVNNRVSTVLAVSTLKRLTAANVTLTDSLAVLAAADRLDLEGLPHDIQSIVNHKVSLNGKPKAIAPQIIQSESDNTSLTKVSKIIREALVAVTHGIIVPPSDNTIGFLEMGLTSQHAVRMANYLSNALGRSISATTMFDHPNIAALANFLSVDFINIKSNDLIQHGSLAESFSGDESFSRTINRDIAVIGMACRFPGSANNPAQFHNLLMEGVCAIKPVPSSRWNSSLWLDTTPDALGKAYSQVGGFLEDRHIFDLDAPFFRISPKEAMSLDPQQRLLLETVWEAFEDAGIPPSACSGKRVGVYIGISTLDYMGAHLWSSNSDKIDGYSATGSMYSAAAGRISYLLNLNGPNFPLDTACSSALTALDCACQALNSGSASLAVVAGVNAMVHPHMFVYFSKLGALSASGRCRTFDAEADGYVRGEGAGAILLKPLNQALSDKDQILAVIKGTAVNHDGASSSFTAPNGSAQQKVIRLALKNAGIKPVDVDYVEAHGTGTRLGDPIEIQALGAVYGENRSKDRPLWVGSVKANIGHLEAAAGMASIIKTIMVLSSGTIPPQVGFITPNPLIPWKDLSVAIPTEQITLSDKKSGHIAGISAFGFSGTNAHVIMAEPPVADAVESNLRGNPAATMIGPEYLLSISAKSPAALIDYCRDYIEFLQTIDNNPELLSDICYTAKIGRTVFDYRCDVTGTETEDLIDALKKIVDNPDTIHNSIPSDNGLHKEKNIPFSPLRKKVSIPTYPFQRKRFWMNPVSTTVPQEPTIHGYSKILGQRIFNNTDSDNAPNMDADNSLDRVAYQVQFNREFPTFIPEHIIYGEPIVPAAAYLSQLFSYFRTQHQNRQNIKSSKMVGVGFDISFTAPMVIHKARFVQLVCLNPEQQKADQSKTDQSKPVKNKTAFKIISRTETESWITHCKGGLEFGENDDKPFNNWASDKPFNQWIDDFCKNCNQTINGSEFYANFKTLGYELGSGFCRIEQAFCGQIESPLPCPASTPIKESESYIQAVCRINLTQSKTTDGYDLYPGFIDAMLQSLVFGAPQILQILSERSKILIPFALDRFEVYAAIPSGESATCLVTTRQEADYLQGDIRVFNEDGLPILSFIGLTVRLTDRDTLLKGLNLAASNPSAKNPIRFYTVRWEESPDAPIESNSEQKILNVDQIESKTPTYSVNPLIKSDECLVFADNGGLGVQIARGLERAGLQCKVVFRENLYSTVDTIDLDRWLKAAIENLIATANHDRLLRIIYLWTSDLILNDNTATNELHQQQIDLLHPALLLIQTLVQSGRSGKFYGITSGAFSIDNVKQKVPAAVQQTIWGLGKTVAIEYPEYFGGLIDFEFNPDPSEPYKSQIDRFISDLLAKEDLDQRAYRNSLSSVGNQGVNLFKPFITISEIKTPEITHHINPDCAYLITGAFGGLGLPIARKMVQLGARKIWLVGRSSPKHQFLSDAKNLEISYPDLKIELIQADMQDYDGLGRALEKLPGGLTSIKGVIHLAGMRKDALLPSQNRDGLESVMAPKAAGAWNLHNLFKRVELDFFVLFSSAAALLGSQGQANYAAANSFLDGLADYRRSIGLPALSIQWGPWAESGMAASETVVLKNLTSLGFDYIAQEQGLNAFEFLLTSNISPVAVFDCDWGVYMERTGQHSSSMFKELRVGLSSDAQVSQTSGNLWKELSDFSQDQINRELLIHLTTLAQSVSGSDVSPDTDRPLMEQGFDSLMAVEFRNQLQKMCGFSLPVTLLFTYPGLVDIANFLQKRHYSDLRQNTTEVKKYITDAAPGDRNREQENNDMAIDTTDIDTEIVTDKDFAYLDQLTPEELNELIAKDLDS